MLAASSTIKGTLPFVTPAAVEDHPRHRHLEPHGEGDAADSGLHPNQWETTPVSDEPHGVVVVDAHAHLFTHSFFQALARQAGKLLPLGDELQAIHERTGVEIAEEPLEPLAARWVQEMDRNRVQRMVLMSSIAAPCANNR